MELPVDYGLFDSDGHIFERDEQIRPFLKGPYQGDSTRTHYFFPSLDGWPRFSHEEDRALTGPTEWAAAAKALSFDHTVLFPTAALGLGFGRNVTWLVELCTAYNDFLASEVTNQERLLKGIAVMPVQNPSKAAEELRRAVGEHGHVGGLLPCGGLFSPYGDEMYDPIYRAAQELGVPLAVHGAARQGMGFDQFRTDYEAFTLAHPVSQMVQFTSMIYGRVFERFPMLKVGFMEAGCGWAPYLIDRIDSGSASRLGYGLASKQVEECPVYFHVELLEAGVPQAIEAVGAERLLFASDFPHEGIDDVEQRLTGFFARTDVSDDNKRAILSESSRAFYALD